MPRAYLLVHDVDCGPIRFKHTAESLGYAVQTAESHCGAEVYLDPKPGQTPRKATCRRVEVWELDGKGRRVQLVTVREDGVRREPRQRLSALAERLPLRPALGGLA